MRNYSQDELHSMGIIELASLWEENQLRQEARSAGFRLLGRAALTCLGLCYVALTLQLIGSLT